MDDLVIRGATVIDGSGTAGRMTDVAVRDGRISAIGPRRSDSARREIDATGLPKQSSSR
jgi:N-acyl-D-amino-acid deacylase